MNSIDFFEDYLFNDNSGLDTTSLVNDYFLEIFGESPSGVLSSSDLSIFDATLHAVIWGYPPEETYRLSNLDTVEQAPVNQIFKPAYAANWLNKNSAPAPDASVLYINAWLDLSAEDLILQTPTNNNDNYYIISILDSFIGTVGSIGPRTQNNSELSQGAYYLLAGPSSIYYNSPDWTTTINDKIINIIKVDTPIAWMTGRFGTDVMSATSLQKTREFINGDPSESGSGFQIGTLTEFENSGSIAYQDPIDQSIINEKAEDEFGDLPTLVTGFFNSLGQSIQNSPIPELRTTDVASPVPSFAAWLGNQNQIQQTPNSDSYLPDSAYQPSSALSDDQKKLLNDRFSSIGLNVESGFSLPTNWGEREAFIFQKAYEFSQQLLSAATFEIAKGKKETNYWNIKNLNIGVYPNSPENNPNLIDWKSLILRAGVAVDGGAANIPNDAVYPTSQLDSDGHPLTSKYNYSITLPPLTNQDNKIIYGPAEGFWAYTIYQPNEGNTFQPFLIQNSISNNFYTPLNATAKLSEEGWLKTTKPGNWSNANAIGTAIYTGEVVSISELSPLTTYYISEIQYIPNNQKEILFKLSEEYNPDFNWDGRIDGVKGVPVGGEGSPGKTINLTESGETLNFGFTNPVSQLGQAQLDSFVLNENEDIVLQLQQFQPTNSSNWLPTPSEGFVKEAYKFQLMGRYYNPTTADEKTILAASEPELYLPPKIERGSLARLALWSDLSQSSKNLVKEKTGSEIVNPLNQKDPYNPNAIGAVLDMRWSNGKLEGTKWALKYEYTRSADYFNKLFFYEVDDITGQIGTFLPGDANYIDSALMNIINEDDPIINQVNNSTVSGELELKGGKIYMALVFTEKGQYLIPNSLETFNYTHFKVNNPKSFSFEDQLGGGDNDHNDGIFKLAGLSPL